MAWSNRKTDCPRIRQWLLETLTQRLDISTAWVQRHLAACPRCRRQIAGNSRLRLALLLVKTQPHSPDLLRRQITLVGSWTFSKQGQAECAEFVADRKIDVDKLFTHSWTLDQAEEAYKLFDTQTTGKAVILPN